MIFTFFSFSICYSSADLLSPFKNDGQRNIGVWEFTGAAKVNATYILLSPPLQFHRGGAWTNVVLPTGNWSVQFELCITEGIDGGFGIWLIDSYGSSGNLGGGPTKFRGVSLIGKVTKKDRINSIDLFVLENDGDLSFETLPTAPDKSIVFHHKRHIFIELTFSDKNMLVKVDASNAGKLKKVLNVSLSTDISKSFLGVTSQSNQQAMRLELYGIQFKANRNTTTQRFQPIVEIDKYGNFKPNTNLKFRNPKFQKLLNYSTYGLGKEATLTEVFDSIDEVSDVCIDVASYKDLSEFVRKSVHPFSEKWQRRTIKTVEYSKSVERTIKYASNATQNILKSFNETIAKEALSVKRKINHFTDFYEELNEANEENKPLVFEISLNTEQQDKSLLVVYFLLFEIMLLFTYISRKSYEN